MTSEIHKISNDFWNIRGDFKIASVLNIGTHCSLVKRKNGKFVLLDAYTLPDAIKAQVDAKTNNGDDIEALINLHPFHTLHVNKAHAQYPQAKLYGTQRHLDKFPNLPWQPELSESQECAALFAEDLLFSIPEGVDFISHNEHLHCSSVLAYHKASKTIHSDDTLMYLPLPFPLSMLKKPEVSFHPTLSKTLHKRTGAAREFRLWATQLAQEWSEAENLCAAHSASLLKSDKSAATIEEHILNALRKVEKVLRNHESKYA